MLIPTLIEMPSLLGLVNFVRCAQRVSIKRLIANTIRGGPVLFANVSNIILILRLHALYNRSPKGNRKIIWYRRTDRTLTPQLASFDFSRWIGSRFVSTFHRILVSSLNYDIKPKWWSVVSVHYSDFEPTGLGIILRFHTDCPVRGHSYYPFCPWCPLAWLPLVSVPHDL